MRAAIVYDDRARTFIGAWKERGRRDLSHIAAELVVESVARPVVDAVCFVPGDPDRSLKRGHVPARELALGLAERWEIPNVSVLSRPFPGRRQRALPRAERRSNVNRAFVAAGVVPGRVCLVDDVYTTGSTAAACAAQLRRAGARHVEVVCLARAIR